MNRVDPQVMRASNSKIYLWWWIYEGAISKVGGLEVRVSRREVGGAVIYSLVFERLDLAAKLNPSMKVPGRTASVNTSD